MCSVYFLSVPKALTPKCLFLAVPPGTRERLDQRDKVDQDQSSADHSAHDDKDAFSGKRLRLQKAARADDRKDQEKNAERKR